MDLISRYLIKDLFIALVFITASLTFAVWLTQILRFLEFVIEAGAPVSLFIQILLLSIPKLFEIVLPIGVLAGVLFIYNKMIADNEIIVMRASGLSEWDLAKPVLFLSLFIAGFSFLLGGWLGPLSNTKSHEIRQIIRAQYSTTFLSEGVFNSFGNGLTVYIGEKLGNGELKNIIIHQNEIIKGKGQDAEKIPASTVVAERGLLVTDGEKSRVIVSKGTRQQKDNRTGYVSRLDFDSYTIDVTPERKEVVQRWREPGQRTIIELFSPDMGNPVDVQKQHEFRSEIHKRITAPFLLINFALMALTFLLVGNFNRRGYSKKITACLIMAVLFQTLFLTFVNLAKKSSMGILGLYLIAVLPVFVFIFLLNKDAFRFGKAISHLNNESTPVREPA